MVLTAVETGHTEQSASDRVRHAQRRVPDQYIVVLVDGVDANAVAAEAENAHGGRRRHVFQLAANGFAMELSEVEARRLSRDPRVKFVEEDSVVTLEQAIPWGLDRIDERTRPTDGTFTPGGLGTGVTVHVIDTGIRVTHQEFGGRASIFADYIDDDGNTSTAIGNDDADAGTPDGADCHGHGTHVAGTIGGATFGVAKNVTLKAHRVLNCAGAGMLSDVIAAIDAVTASPERPAIANLSLGSAASDALDDAVRGSIAAGVTYVVAAGNNNTLADYLSPARVAEAVTVGATDSTDTRASFSNYGTLVDLFAPGVGVTSAWYTTDTSTNVLYGTSMATPHVAGAAAVLLQLHPAWTPAQVQDTLRSAATPNIVTNQGAGSTRRLLYLNPAHLSAPNVQLLRPVAGEDVLSNLPYAVSWQASDPDGLQTFDVLLSTDSGLSFDVVPGCAGLAGSQLQCTWAAPGPVTTTARIRVVAHDLKGDAAFDQSPSDFSIVIEPELVVTQISNLPAAMAPGQSATISETVSNLGNVTASSSTTRYYLSLDAIKSANDIRLSATRAVPQIGASSPSTGTVTISLATSTPLGVYTFFACADDLSVIAEASETNNCTAAPTLLQVAFPDLVESGVSVVPAAAAPGTKLTVSAAIQNLGPPGAGSSTTRFWLSSDTTKGVGDVLLSGTQAVAALLPAPPLISSIIVTVPTSTVPGTYYVLACADDTSKVTESQEANNCAAATSTTLIAKPNLVTSSVSNPPSPVATGASFSVTTVVSNPSPVPAASSRLRFYLSSDAAKGGSDLLLSATRTISTLAAGASSPPGNTTLAVPVSAPLGTFYLLACADDLLAVAESDENNCLAATAPVVVSRPDLTVASISNVPATAGSGLSFTVTDTVLNAATIVGAPASTGRYYLSVDAVKDATDVLLSGNASVPALAPGASSPPANRSLIPPLTTALGTYRLIACADNANSITELDETNNCRVASTTIVVTWPDLVTTSVSTTATNVLPGQTFALSDTVQNQGGHPAGSSTTRYYLSLDLLRDPGDTLLTTTRSVGTLSVGQSSTGTKTLTVPLTTPLNRYYVIACADDLSKLGELDNNNNCRASGELTIGPP
jgi:subtilisin family serine protease